MKCREVDLEAEMVRKLNLVLGKTIFPEIAVIRKLQIEYLTASIIKSVRAQDAHDDLIGVCRKIFDVVTLRVQGEPSAIPETGVVAIANHLGVAKLTKITPADMIGLLHQGGHEIAARDLKLPNNDPFPMLFAPVVAALHSLRCAFPLKFIFVCIDFGGVYSRIMQAVGAVVVNRDSVGQLRVTIDKLKERVMIARAVNAVPIIVIYPEGGTSGKSNRAGIYSLLSFATGYLRVAESLGLPVLPIAISVDATFKFTADLLGCINVDVNTSAESHRQSMQEKLDQRCGMR